MRRGKRRGPAGKGVKVLKMAEPTPFLYPGAPMDKTPAERKDWHRAQREGSKYRPHIRERVIRERKARWREAR